MSADNGIYILKTKDQYRVIHAQAIENLYWSFITENEVHIIVPTRIIEYFGKSKYTSNYDLVKTIAFSMAKKIPVLEYGIKEIEVDQTWNQIVKEAKELALLEIKAIKEMNPNGTWDWDIKRLEEILAM